MKLTLGWLKEHLDTAASLNEITDKLTALGLEVDAVADRAKIYESFRVAYVVSAEKHPDADRLRVCIVDTGKEKLQVVCGAPNARAGMKGVFAPAGSFIPGTGITLKKGVIRGQESNGMLVSEREMGLSEEHDGIIDVPADVPVGTPFAELYGLNDPVIEIGLTPNRADCAGVRGIARDLAAAGLGQLKPLDESSVKGSFKSPVSVKIENLEACPLFLGRYIKGVKNGPSPKWLQDRLKAIGLRPISALVDITNYLTNDLCRPLHVFDADKLKGNIQVRLARKGETLEALNDKTYELSDFMAAVCDDSGVLALGGVMGGVSTGCTEGTVNVYVECAYFDPYRTAKTGRALQIDSDARYRFERGIDPAFTIAGMEIATRLILDLCGGQASEVVTAGAAPQWKRAIDFDPAYTKKLAGIDVPAARQKEILAALGFTFDSKGAAQPPSWRADLEGRADLLEEIARITGYDKLPATSLRNPASVTHSAETTALARARKARTALSARGLDECVSWSFMEEKRAQMFGANNNQSAAALKLANPISAELSQMRPSLLPNLIDAAQRNHDRGLTGAAIFEVGPAFVSQKIDGQVLVAAGVRFGHHGPRHWSGPQCSRMVDAFDAKADALCALAACGAPVEGLQVSRDAPAWYHPGRSGSLRLGASVLAHFGEIHPGVLEEMKVDEAVAAFEVFLDNVPPQRRKGTARAALALSPFQPVFRDFAFIVDAGLEAETLVRTVKTADKTLIAGVDVFDVYTGKGVEDGKKSVALSVTIRPQEKTLTDTEIEALSKRIIDSVAAKTGGQLRG